MRVLLIAAFLIWAIAAPAIAQDCEVETCTPTPTATPTETPNIVMVWALPTTVNDLGTPSAPQYASFSYSADAGQVLIGGLLAVLVFSLWAMFTIWLVIRVRGGSKAVPTNG